jgi:hypothetical protein
LALFLLWLLRWSLHSHLPGALGRFISLDCRSWALFRPTGFDLGK